MKPLVSIITTAYNHEEYIEQCIQSVIKQTFPHWEMIIIDDLSTDKTFFIASKFTDRDRRIRIIRHKTNWGIKGLKDSYNQALKISKGKLIAILEGDDFWPKDKLERQVKDFKNKNIVLSYGSWIMTDIKGSPVHLRRYKDFNKNYLNNKPISSIYKLFSTLQFDIGSPTVLIRKNSLLRINGFRQGKFYPFIDIPNYLELAKIGQFKYINEILGYYRRIENSSWFKYAQSSKTMGRQELKKEIDYFFKKNNLKIKFNEVLQNQYLTKRKQRKYLSVLLNKALYKNNLFNSFIKMLLRIKFWWEYFDYKFTNRYKLTF